MKSIGGNDAFIFYFLVYYLQEKEYSVQQVTEIFLGGEYMQIFNVFSDSKDSPKRY